MRAQAWLKKKLTDIVKVKATTKNAKIDGVIVGDKVGEVKYASFDKLRADGVRQLVVQAPNTEDNEQEEAARTLFG